MLFGYLIFEFDKHIKQLHVLWYERDIVLCAFQNILQGFYPSIL